MNRIDNSSNVEFWFPLVYRQGMDLVLDLADVTTSMLDLVGGKALNLGVMIAADLPVPPGFCVTTHAYRLVTGAALEDRVRALDDAEAHHAEAIRAQVLGLGIPDVLRATILQHYRGLGAREPVAVRSSATAEDLAYASFAGQQDTYLNMVGEDAVLAAVQRCWASLWTDRAISYRRANGIDHRLVTLAVVVQRMVQASVAGVMFTANPVTGTRHQTVIDASPGLGEAVVSGAVNPDHFIVDRRSRAIVERRLGDKTVTVSGVPGGGVVRRDHETASESFCLDDTQVLALADLGQRVQDHYGAPQDTEWALDGQERLWLTQARPVTTLYPVPAGESAGLRAMVCMTLAQGLTRPITPMGLAAFRLIGSSVATAFGVAPAPLWAGPRGMHNLSQRVYLDITGVLRNRPGRTVIIAAFSVMEARAAEVVRGLVEQPEFALLASPLLRTVGPVARVALRAGVPVRLLTAVVSPPLARRAISRIERRLRAGLVVPAGLSPQQRLSRVEQRLGSDIFFLMPTVFAYAAAGFACLALARRLLGDLARPEEIQQVQRSLPHNVTTEMDLELWELTERIRGDEASRTAFLDRPARDVAGSLAAGVLPKVADRGLREFLSRYGHRAVAEIDLGMPRWSDDPSHLIGVIGNYLRLTDPDLAPPAQFERGARAAKAMIATLTSRARHRSRFRGRLVGWSLGRARHLTGLRESPKFLLILALAAMRQQLAEVGSSLQADGRIASSDDVFFLDFGDVRRGLAGTDLRSLVVQRRQVYAAELRRRHVPRLLLSDGTEPEAVAVVVDRPDGALVGSPASAGTVTGRARVVLDPVGAHLEPGEILVAPSTDPGWTPMFLTAGGLVMEMGGSNSHGAVVAREYGIPAVVGVPSATRRIETGQLITVDGGSGLVSPAG